MDKIPNIIDLSQFLAVWKSYLFTSVLKAINFFGKNYFSFIENQSELRKGHSTIDSVFVLHIYSLFELLKMRKKTLFRAFTDFAKVFDTVW